MGVKVKAIAEFTYILVNNKLLSKVTPSVVIILEKGTLEPECWVQSHLIRYVTADAYLRGWTQDLPLFNKSLLWHSQL